MKKISVILIGLLFLSFSPESYILKYGKKINKEVKKIFKQENIKISDYELPGHISLGIENRFYQIDSEDNKLGYININRVNACRVGGCDRPDPLNTVRYDHFYYMAVFSNEFSILKVIILDYQSEHGYEICSRTWLKQFIGSSDREFSYNKNVDAISGATVSVNSIIDEINILTSALKRIN